MASMRSGADKASNTEDISVREVNDLDDVNSFIATKRNLHDRREYWNILGWAVPKNEVVFFAQIFAVFLLMITSIVNLSLEKGDSKVWISFLAGSCSSLLPAPVLRMEKIRTQT